MDNNYDYEKLYDIDLKNNDNIVIVGGYKGYLANKLYDKFLCNIYIFEPVVEFYSCLIDTFKNNEKIKIFNYALLDKNYIGIINIKEDGSSLFKKGDRKKVVQIKRAAEAINDLKLSKINLLF